MHGTTVIIAGMIQGCNFLQSFKKALNETFQELLNPACQSFNLVEEKILKLDLTSESTHDIEKTTNAELIKNESHTALCSNTCDVEKKHERPPFELNKAIHEIITTEKNSVVEPTAQDIYNLLLKQNPSLNYPKLKLIRAITRIKKTYKKKK